MATNFKQWIAAGWDSLQIGRRGPGGYLVGGLAELDATDTNTYSEMYHVIGANSAGYTFNQPQVVDVQGDDRSLGTFKYAAGTNPSFPVTLAARDMNVLQIVTGVAPTAFMDGYLHPGISDEYPRNRVIALLSRQAQFTLSGNDTGYEHLLLLNVDITDVSQNRAYQAAGSWELNFTLNPSNVDFNGLATSASTGRVSTFGYEFTTSKRVTMGAFVGNGTADDITTIQDPISTTLSSVWVETTGFAAGTVSAVGANQLTLSAAPGSGKFAIVSYEFTDWE